MKKSIRICLLFVAVMLFALQSAEAQNTIRKTAPAFKAGETLKCNLYFNWKFVCVCDTVHIIVMGCVYAR